MTKAKREQVSRCRQSRRRSNRKGADGADPQRSRGEPGSRRWESGRSGAEKGLVWSRRYYLQTPGMRGESSAMFLPIIIKINFVFRYAFLKKSTKEYSQM